LRAVVAVGWLQFVERLGNKTCHAFKTLQSYCENEGVLSWLRYVIVVNKLVWYRNVIHGHFIYCIFKFWHYCTNGKAAGSIPDGFIGIFHWLNPSGRTMALGLTQPPT
jgi:hypothetical protein